MSAPGISRFSRRGQRGVARRETTSGERATPTPSPRPVSPRKRILLVDDHPLLREGAAQCIASSGDLEVCGEAGTAAEAIEAVSRLQPDLVVTDLTLPGRSGLELIKDLHAIHSGLPVLVFSIHDEALHAGRALRAGARGYLMKGARGARLLESIRQVLQGDIALSPEMSTRLLEEYAGRPARTPNSGSEELTEREREVFHLIGQALTNREIAAKLRLSHKTVETHRLAIQRKLKLKTTADLVRYAIHSCRDGGGGGFEAP